MSQKTKTNREGRFIWPFALHRMGTVALKSLRQPMTQRLILLLLSALVALTLAGWSLGLFSPCSAPTAYHFQHATDSVLSREQLVTQTQSVYEEGLST